MVENMSLADKAVEVLGMVKAMDADMTNDRPERCGANAGIPLPAGKLAQLGVVGRLD